MLGYGKAVVVGWDHRLGIIHYELLRDHYESVAGGAGGRESKGLFVPQVGELVDALRV
jgi:hypothetical protein